MQRYTMAIAALRKKEPDVESIPLEEQIRRRAYELYGERGDQPGSAIDDWLRAEEEIMASREQHAAGAAGE